MWTKLSFKYRSNELTVIVLIIAICQFILHFWSTRIPFKSLFNKCFSIWFSHFVRMSVVCVHVNTSLLILRGFTYQVVLTLFCFLIDIYVGVGDRGWGLQPPSIALLKSVKIRAKVSFFGNNELLKMVKKYGFGDSKYFFSPIWWTAIKGYVK